MASNTEKYRGARDQLVGLIGDYQQAVDTFQWPQLTGTFNWAIDWFDVIARDNDRIALWIVEEDGAERQGDVRADGRPVRPCRRVAREAGRR